MKIIKNEQNEQREDRFRNLSLQSRVLFTVQGMKCSSLTLFIAVTIGTTARHSSYNLEPYGSVRLIPSETH